MANTLYFIHSNDIYILAPDNTTTYCNLFGHPWYYMQNDNKDVDIRNHCKALMFLHTLPFEYRNVLTDNANFKSFFNKKDGVGGIETVPYGYLLLLGGLIWRKKYMEAHNNSDPIIYDDNVNHYIKPGKDNTLFLYTANNKYFLVCSLQNSGTYEIKYDKFVGTNGNTIIENRLVDYFDRFVKEEFPIIIEHCELKKIDSGETGVKDMTLSDIVYLRNYLSTYNNKPDSERITESTNVLKGDSDVLVNNTPKFRVSNFSTHYAVGFIDNTNLLCLFYSEDNYIQRVFNDLFFKEVLVTTIPNKISNDGIDKTALSNYFKGYATLLESYQKISKTKEKLDENFVEETDDQRDFKCEIYLTLKNIWDRWLCGYFNSNDTESFTIKNFFSNNFVFIDSFYNNIYDTLKLNCEIIYDQFKNKTNNQTKLGVSTVAHLGSVAGEHMCMMFNFPDNVNFAEIDSSGNTKEVNMIQNMMDVFTPMPANCVSGPDYLNKFTIIYTHSANKLDTVDRNKFVHDSFDIWSFDSGTGVAPSVFNTSCGDYSQGDIANMTNNARIGYKVPAFGVAYSRQNNSLWKNIQVNMDNFSVTEQAVRAEAQIAEKGNSESRNITFYGQDIYSLYQAYSYLVTVEMMGDAQIQPLMYFQLMNVPMFRGTYMIIKVEHSIKPGNMTTTFTGMKMSKVQAPYTTAWYTKSGDASYVSVPPPIDMDTADNGEKIIATDGTEIDIADNKLSKAINKHKSDTTMCDDFVIAVYGDLGVEINNNLS